MKKSILVFGVLLLFLFASCGGNKWSCKKRYCKTPPVEVLKMNQDNCIVTVFNEENGSFN